MAQLLVMGHLWLIWCTFVYDWMELYDHPVSGQLFISCPTIPALSGLFIIQYNPLQYFIIYFSITWNGITLIPFYYFISMEFFQLFLFKFFSNHSRGMVREIFCRFSFQFLYFGQVWGYGQVTIVDFLHHLVGVFWEGNEFGCRCSICWITLKSLLLIFQLL